MKTYDVYGLGNALVDILVRVSDKEFSELNLEKATMRLVEIGEQKELLARVKDKKPHLASGGSTANSIIGAAQLGAKAAFSGCIGDDKYGLFYKNEFESLGIDMPVDPQVGATTGTCVVTVTPDAERTMRTCLAISSSFSESEISEEAIRRAKWLFIEGYQFANPGPGQAAIKKAIELSKAHGTKIAITCSEAWVVESFSKPFFEAFEQADLIFANESEACACSGGKSAEESFSILSKKLSNVCVTAGERGAYVKLNDSQAFCPTFPCTPVDVTGAGDIFAAAIFYGMTHGHTAAEAGTAGCYLASKVISQMGARLHTGLKDLWSEALTLRAA